MRPRPDAAENGDRGRLGRRGHRASMRPRPDAAENGRRHHVRVGGAAASMRPRPDAAENVGGTVARRSTPQSFNEAAARCRGKPARIAVLRGAR